MITPSYGLTATERVLPKLALDFTTATLDSRVAFTRSGATATRVNSSGLIEAVAADLPRFDFDPVTLACKGLLIEETRTNAQRYSIPVENGFYGGARRTIVDNQIVSPDGTQNAPRIDCTTTSASGMNINSPLCTVSSGATVTGSLYLKKGHDDWCAVVLFDASANGVRQYFNLSTIATGGSGAFGTGWAKVSATIVDAGNGWRRVTFTASITGTNVVMIVTSSCAGDGDLSCIANVTFGYPWGLQVEEGAFATSYIPTTTTALTRNADVATMTGTNFSSFWQAGRGGVLVRALPSTVSGTRPLVQFDDNTADNIIALRGNTTNPELYIVDGGTPQAQIDAGTIAANTAYDLTGWWQTNFCAARKDNGARVEDLTATIPTVTQARLGSDGTNYLNGHLATINYYARFSGQIYSRRKNKAVFNVI